MGVPKETEVREYRVGMVSGGVDALVVKRHDDPTYTMSGRRPALVGGVNALAGHLT